MSYNPVPNLAVALLTGVPSSGLGVTPNSSESTTTLPSGVPGTCYASPPPGEMEARLARKSQEELNQPSSWSGDRIPDITALAMPRPAIALDSMGDLLAELFSNQKQKELILKNYGDRPVYAWGTAGEIGDRTKKGIMQRPLINYEINFELNTLVKGLFKELVAISSSNYNAYNKPLKNLKRIDDLISTMGHFYEGTEFISVTTQSKRELRKYGYHQITVAEAMQALEKLYESKVQAQS